MKFFREHETVVDGRITKLNATLHRNFARTSKVFDLAEWVR